MYKTASAQLLPLTGGPGALFLSSQFLAKAKYPTKATDLSGQTAIITGSNTGIGLTCAGMLLGLGLSHLILAVRSQVKGEAAAKSLKQKPSGSNANIEVWPLDMGSYDSIQKFLVRCKTLSRVDVVILNAGVMQDHFNVHEATGHNEMMQINFLSTALLCTMLLPVLKESKSRSGRTGRITVVSSSLAMFAKFPQHREPNILHAFDVEGPDFDFTEYYSTTKLLMHLYLDKLSQFVGADDLVVNCVDPGFVRGTGLHRGDSIRGGVARGGMAITKALMARSLEAGASTYLDAAIVKGPESHGSYLMDWKIAPYANFYYTPGREEVQERLWKEVMEEFKFVNMEEIILSMKK